MALGITNLTDVSLTNITQLANVTGDPIQFMIRANHVMFDGWFYFFMLIVLGIILYFVAQDRKDQPLNNIMITSTVLAMISFFMRAITMVENGVVIGLISDFQMWIFPLFAVIMAGIVWFIKA